MAGLPSFTSISFDHPSSSTSGFRDQPLPSTHFSLHFFSLHGTHRAQKKPCRLDSVSREVAVVASPSGKSLPSAMPRRITRKTAVFNMKITRSACFTARRWVYKKDGETTILFTKIDRPRLVVKRAFIVSIVQLARLELIRQEHQRQKDGEKGDGGAKKH